VPINGRHLAGSQPTETIPPARSVALAGYAAADVVADLFPEPLTIDLVGQQFPGRSVENLDVITV
jgi:hypothetical protein